MKQHRKHIWKRGLVSFLAAMLVLNLCAPAVMTRAEELPGQDPALQTPAGESGAGEYSQKEAWNAFGEKVKEGILAAWGLSGDTAEEGASDEGAGNAGDGTSGEAVGNTGDGTSGEEAGNTGDGTSGGEDGNTGDGTSGEEAGNTGDGTSGGEDGNTGDGTSGEEAGNTGDGTSGEEAGNTGDGTSGEEAGNTGDGTTEEEPGTENGTTEEEPGTDETDNAALYAQYMSRLAELEEEVKQLEPTEEVLDAFYFDGLLAVWDEAQTSWGDDLLTDEQMNEINLKAYGIKMYLQNELHYVDGDFVTFGAGEMDGDLTPVAGNGITFRLFDYDWDINNLIAQRGDLSDYFCFRGSGMSTAHPNNGIPDSYNTTYDADGYTSNHATVQSVLGAYDSPVLQLAKDALGNSRTDPGISESHRNLGFLFDYGTSGYVTAYSPSNTILQYDSSTNRYFYNSKNNAVDYDADNNVFRLRKYVENTQSTSSYSGYYDFLPFNYTGGTKVAGQTYNVATGDANYWFGMTMEVDFYMPKNGQINGQDMKFHFSGDDDVWVFIDDVLVLDLGGTHGTVEGDINFATGQVLQYLSWSGANATDTEKEKGSNTSFPTTLSKRYQEAGKAPNGGWNADGTTFGDYTKHTLKFFYLERGAAVANCSLDFNLPTLPDNTLQLGKELTVSNPADEDSPVKEYLDSNLSYQFRIWECDETGNKIGTTPLFANQTFKIKQDGISDTTGTVSADGIISLKADQMAVFTNMLATYRTLKHYMVEEILSNDLKGQYGNIEFKINGENGSSFVPEKTEGMAGYTSFFSHVITIDEVNKNTSATVLYTNKVDINKLSMLKVTKKLSVGSVNTTEAFPITVTLNGVPVEAGTQYIVNDNTSDIRTVEAGGIIRLKANETATLVKGIISGTEFAVTETLSGDLATIWTPSYSGTVTSTSGTETLNGTETGISGTFALNSTAHVTVTNSSYDLSCEIPITKTYYGNTNTTKNFGFYLTNWEGSVLDGAVTTITVTNGNPTKGAITLGYQSDIAPGIYSYTLHEAVDETDLETNFDTRDYDVEVTVTTGADNKKTAEVTRISLDGKNCDSAEFVNYRTTDVTVTKTVDGNMGDHNREFKFTASLEDLSMQGVTYQKYSLNAAGTAYEKMDGASGTVSRDTFSFTLKHGEKIVLDGIQIDADMTVTEEDTEYHEFVSVNKSDSTETLTANLKVARSGNVIDFKNTNDVVVETGIHTDTYATYLMMSAMIVLAGFLMLGKARYTGKF